MCLAARPILIFEDEMATTTGVATTHTAMTGSPYAPKVNGKLLSVRLYAAGDAVTSLLEMVEAKLSCPLWGVDLYVVVCAGQIRTVPAFPIPAGRSNCDLPVKVGVNIVCEYRHQTGATPVTPQIKLTGVFQGRP